MTAVQDAAARRYSVDALLVAPEWAAFASDAEDAAGDLIGRLLILPVDSPAAAYQALLGELRGLLIVVGLPGAVRRQASFQVDAELRRHRQEATT